MIIRNGFDLKLVDEGLSSWIRVFLERCAFHVSKIEILFLWLQLLLFWIGADCRMFICHVLNMKFFLFRV